MLTKQPATTRSGRERRHGCSGPRHGTLSGRIRLASVGAADAELRWGQVRQGRTRQGRTGRGRSEWAEGRRSRAAPRVSPAPAGAGLHPYFLSPCFPHRDELQRLHRAGEEGADKPLRACRECAGFGSASVAGNSVDEALQWPLTDQVQLWVPAQGSNRDRRSMKGERRA